MDENSFWRCGTALEISVNSNENIIHHNVIDQNDYGIVLEGGLMGGPCSGTIYKNTIKNNTYGLKLTGYYEDYAESIVSDNEIFKNTIANNEYGIHIAGSYGHYDEGTAVSNNIFSKNEIKDNTEYGIYVTNYEDIGAVKNNQFYLNNLRNNGNEEEGENVYDNSQNIWYLENPLGQNQGNYYDDWVKNELYDQGKYQIPGGNNVDKYPLEDPYEGGKIKTTNLFKLPINQWFLNLLQFFIKFFSNK
jgi:hypothetical protein